VWPVLALLAALIAVWLFIVWALLTEGSYLGGPFVRWSYDALARWYERKWRSPEYQTPETTQTLFIAPVLDVAGDSPSARVLDLACGTGRGSRLLLAEPRFVGTITAIDFSPGMLARFREALAALPPAQRERVSIQERDLRLWRCPDPESYDAALFLEAVELIPGSDRVLFEAAGALKPGGVFVTTRVGDRFRWLFRSRRQSTAEFTARLHNCGLIAVAMTPWRSRYNVVTARKADSLFARMPISAGAPQIEFSTKSG